MKRVDVFLFFAIALFLGSGCIGEPADNELCTPSDGIVRLQIASLSSTEPTRAAAVGAETRITHLDVLIFDASGERIYYEQVVSPASGADLQLRARKSAFVADAAYDVYVFANVPVSAEMADVADYAALKNKTVTTEHIHASGLHADPEVPQTFLMDGSRLGVVLNPSAERLTDKVVAVALSRAAAKIVLRLRTGDKAQLLYDAAVPTSLVLRSPVNFPQQTHLCALSDEEAIAFHPQLYTAATPAATGIAYALNDAIREVELTLYAYSNDWSVGDAYTSEPRVLLKVPLRYCDNPAAADAEWISRENNYYLVEVNNVADAEHRNRLLRNHIYTTRFEINGLGGTQIETALPLTDVHFDTQPWADCDVVVGGDDDRPQFLYLSADRLRMDNTTEDHSVRYSSSSTVAVTIDEIYYYNKFGIKTTLSPLETGIAVEPSTAVGEGVLDITGPARDANDNAIRYIHLTVTNLTGQSQQLIVEEYPLVYITNQLSYFSYRSDFTNRSGQPTTWLNHESSVFGNADKTGVGLSAATEENWAWSNYSSNRNDWVSSWNGEKVFVSKIQRQSAYDATTGLGLLASYGWFLLWDSSWFDTTPVRNNAHIYQVRITTTSDDYVLGRPRMKTYADPDGTVYSGTDDGADNQKMVSPSFMIASQLGLAQSGTLIQQMQQAASHCEKYVEVAYRNADNRTDNAADLVVYDDWRLPTQAELRIIGRFQTGSLVMDVVLDRPNYWSAGGVLEGVGAGAASDGTVMSGTGIRCVRDAYRPK